MENLEFLKTLCNLSASSGSEKAVQNFLEKEFGALSLYIKRSGLGDIIATNYEDGECDILFDAHSDQVGFVATEILENGFIKVSPVGSPDPRAVSGAKVLIFGEERLEGVITTTPPHLQKEKELRDLDSLYVDTGLLDLEKLVSVGDRICFYPVFSELLNGKIAATGLDNKISVLALYMAAKKLKNTDKKIAFGFSGREEVGLSGAKGVAETVSPRRAVVVDVSFGFTGKGKKEECGKVGGGVMIGFSPVLSEEFSLEAEKICKKNSIPSQREIMHSRTGTDADAISISGRGVETITASIPIYAMHTGTETVLMNDVENTAEFLVKLASDLEG
jgi:endoglucanase